MPKSSEGVGGGGGWSKKAKKSSDVVKNGKNAASLTKVPKWAAGPWSGGSSGWESLPLKSSKGDGGGSWLKKSGKGWEGVKFVSNCPAPKNEVTKFGAFALGKRDNRDYSVDVWKHEGKKHHGITRQYDRSGEVKVKCCFCTRTERVTCRKEFGDYSDHDGNFMGDQE